MAAQKLRFMYSGIRVRDLDRSLAFYSGLGFRVHKRGQMEHGGIWVHLKLPGQPHRLELNYYAPGNPHYEPVRKGTEFDHFGFRVSDVQAWADRAEKAGGKIVLRIVETHENLAYVEDPDGVWIEFFGPPARKRRKPA
ncbi:MAG: VOC family protein [Thermoplasmata archaeon]|nr:VOC family protein [Thermoplasmata archaeon]